MSNQLTIKYIIIYSINITKSIVRYYMIDNCVILLSIVLLNFLQKKKTKILIICVNMYNKNKMLNIFYEFNFKNVFTYSILKLDKDLIW